MLLALSAYCGCPLLRHYTFCLSLAAFHPVTDDEIDRVVGKQVFVGAEVDIGQDCEQRSAEKDHPRSRSLQNVKEQVRQLRLEHIRHA